MVKITLAIEGMMCGMCEAHMNDAIRNAFKVKAVSSSHTNKQTVILAADAIDESALRKVVTAQGYTLQGITVAPYEKKSLFAKLKK